MKKLIFLGLILISITSCERNGDTVVQSPYEQNIITNESHKNAIDSTFEINSLESGLEPMEPIEGLDPKDITPPRR